TSGATVQGPILSTTKLAPVATSPGGNLTYSITVKNTGLSPANSLVISDTIPANTTYAAGSMDYRLVPGGFIPLTDNPANDDRGYAFADHVEFRLPSLAAGATVTFRFHVNVGSVTTPNFVNNFAMVDSTETDPLTTNLAQTQIVVSSSITPPPVVNSPIFA